MNILVDRHHADLFYSEQLLFETRLAHRVFAPTGRDWWDRGYWRFGEVYGDDRLVRQFLEPQGREVEPGLFLSFDNCHPERPVYSVTLERALSMPWGAVVASVDENQHGYSRFARESGARYLYHMGNARQGVDWSLSPLIISTSEVSPSREIGVRISQEFDADTIFRWRGPDPGRRRITSFVNLQSLVPEMQAGFDGLRDALPEWEFRSFGHSNPDGFLTPVAAIAEEMARASWAYHDKTTGDGFGHIIHNWAAVGRPLIGHASYYSGQIAERFWQDGVTCIDLDRHSIEEAAEIVRTMSAADHLQMCCEIQDAFDDAYTPNADSLAVEILMARQAVPA